MCLDYETSENLIRFMMSLENKIEKKGTMSLFDVFFSVQIQNENILFEFKSCFIVKMVSDRLGLEIPIFL